MKKAVFVLSGGLIKDERGVWRTYKPENGKENVFGATDSRWRILATYYFCKNNPDVIAFVFGGKGTLVNELPEELTLADVMADELKELGISEDRILKEKETNNTYEQLVKIIELSKTNNIENIYILSSEWHIPRIEAMINYKDSLVSLRNKNVVFLGAEEILLKYDKNKYQKEVDMERNNEGAKLRMEKENNGVEQIKNGTYRYEFKK